MVCLTLYDIILQYVPLKSFVLKQSLKETHSFAPSFNLRRANQRRAKLRRASGDPYIFSTKTSLDKTELQLFIWDLDFNFGCTPWLLGCTYVAAASLMRDFFFL